MLNNCKHKLRVYCKAIIKENIHKIQATETRLIIIKQLSQLIDLLNTFHIGLYYPNQYEIDILDLMKLRTDLFFALPKIIANEIIYAKYEIGDKLIKNKFNLYEPENITPIRPNLICLPALGFSQDGYRLGHGGGFFDRYLMKHPTIFKVGIGIKKQFFSNLPTNKFDQKLSYILTEEE